MSQEPVGIDSDILIHAYHQTKNDQDDISERARRLLEWLFDQKRPVYLSVISIGEFLVKVPLGKHARTIQSVDQHIKAPDAPAINAGRESDCAAGVHKANAEIKRTPRR